MTRDINVNGLKIMELMAYYPRTILTTIFAIYAKFHSQMLGDKFGINDKKLGNFRQKWSRIEQLCCESQAIILCSFHHAA